MRTGAAFLFVAIALVSGPAAAQSLLYRVDQATAVVDSGVLVVSVKGAARTGGWKHPQLVAGRGASGNLELHFVAMPPQASAAVVQSIVPLKAQMKTRAPGKNVAAVKVVSETNTVTAQIVLRRQRTALK